jgi:hypothetical protein
MCRASAVVDLKAARGSVVVRALCYKPEGGGIDTRETFNVSQLYRTPRPITGRSLSSCCLIFRFVIGLPPYRL